jgi:hypothetical protein
MAVLPVLALAATAVSAAGTLASGISQMNAANAAASYAKKAAAENARRNAVAAQKQIGGIRANYGASGVTVEGSPLDVLEESARAAELDRLSILSSGRVAAAGYKYAGQDALYQGIGSAAGTLLGGTLDYLEGGSGSEVTDSAGNTFRLTPTG